ncbi:MAG TPA: cation:proton antiporter [Blastocatellia bacterium]|jgi:Kef-type K+ transport system membrane component KefB|nr:cation:proton antiporter [Blastocatellia bacterium]
MRINKNLLFYVVALSIFGAGIVFILSSGSRLDKAGTAQTNNTEAASVMPAPSEANKPVAGRAGIGKALSENARSALSVLLLQIIVIIIAARLLGSLFLKIGQPAVIGEMIAGILLGPSLLGLLSPSTISFLFPVSSMGTLKLLSEIGVILFMFTVGMEMNAQHLREKAHAAVIVSHASIVVPFFLGVTLSLALYRPFAPPNISFMSFALFIGVAMSITAFPVLARILEEKGLSRSPLGSTAIACAAVDDITAWCLLTLVIAVSNGSGPGASILTIFLSVLFIALMIFLIKPPLARVISRGIRSEKRGKVLLAGVMAFVMACAWLTELIGIHALFGAFLAGVVMPSNAGYRAFLKERLETFSSAALLPLFFAFTGLRTQITLLNDWQSVLIGAAIIAVAIAGKLGGSSLAARWTGMSWRDSLSIGVLMNTRGLVELIVLNIGYDLGILPARIFAIMVLMALTTTFMTGPLLTLIRRGKTDEAELTPAASPSGQAASTGSL